MSYRQFRDFKTAAGNNVVKAWMKSLSPAERADVHQLILALEVEQFPPDQDFKALGGTGLWEIRLKGEKKRALRVLCCKGPGDGEFTMLEGVIKQGFDDKWKIAIESAKAKRTIALKTPTRTCDHEFD